MPQTQYYGTGRRKRSIARVYLTEGEGNILVNNLNIKEYFKRNCHVIEALAPLASLEKSSEFNANIKVNGGGHTGQSGAIRLGISRALMEFDLELRPTLKSFGYLTRDSRKVERKKYGQKGARAKFQFSKR